MRPRHFIVPALLFAFALASLLGLREPRHAHAQVGDGTLLDQASGWNISSVASGGTVFATALKTSRAVSCIRIGVVLGSTAPLSIQETDGTHTFTSYLNGGTALTAGCMYTFVWETRNANAPGGVAGGPTTFNFVVGGPTTVPVLRVTELIGGVD